MAAGSLSFLCTLFLFVSLVSSSACPFSKDDLPTPKSLFRAHMPSPRLNFKGTDMRSMSNVLNQALRSQNDMTLKHCSEFSLEELFELQKSIIRSSHPHFQHVYSSKNDRRRMLVNSLEELEERQRREKGVIEENPELEGLTRDGRCHETIMWYVHHLTEDFQSELRKNYTFPLLPAKRHVTFKSKRSESPTPLDQLYKTYDDSLSCVSCHTFKTDHHWPSLAGFNNRTGQMVKQWPNEFDVSFDLEVKTDKGQKGLPDIDNAPGNHFHYKWDDTKPMALNRHLTCPFFKQLSCDIHHRTDGIYIVLNPDSILRLCCRAFPVSVVPPYWVSWGLYVDTSYLPNENITADRFIFGEAIQLDEHDYWISVKDGRSVVRFHATLPPPNNHTHGYWHVKEPMNIRPQPDSIFNTKPSLCLPSCGIKNEVEMSMSKHVMPWPTFTEEHLSKLTLEYKAFVAESSEKNSKITVN